MTALGVMEGIKALAEEVLGSKSLVGIRVAIQGLGKVGMSLVEYAEQMPREGGKGECRSLKSNGKDGVKI